MIYLVNEHIVYEHDDLFDILGVSQLLMIYVYLCWEWTLKHMIDEMFCVERGALKHMGKLVFCVEQEAIEHVSTYIFVEREALEHMSFETFVLSVKLWNT